MRQLFKALLLMVVLAPGAAWAVGETTGRIGGAESVVKGLLGRYVRGEGPARVTLMANAAVASAYADHVGGAVRLLRIRGMEVSDGRSGRVVALARGFLRPGAFTAQLPPDVHLVHYPVAVPLPRTRHATIVTLHDVLHRELPHLFSRPARA